MSRGAVLAVVAVAVVMLLGLITVPMLIVGGSGLLFESGSGCAAAQGQGQQPVASSDARDSIPANYLVLFQRTGAKYGVPWVVLAGIGEVESDDGRSNLPGVHSGANAFGAAGPMQIGIGGAAGNEWGGAPVHPASEQVNGMAADGDGDGIASVYDPADAIAGAAKYLIAHGVQSNVQTAIFASELLWSPIFRRFPRLKMSLAEGGIGWVPYFMEKADFVYDHHRRWTGQDFGDKLPSQVFREHVQTCFIDDETGLRNRHHIGIGRGLAQELHHRVETLEGMMDDQVLFPDGGKTVAAKVS